MYIEAFGKAFIMAISWALFGIIGGILLGKIVGSYIEGAVGVLESVVVGGMYLVLFAMVVFAPDLTTRLIDVALLLLLLFGWPFVVERMGRRQDRQFYSERMRQFREAIERDPMNLAARERLVEVLHREGCFDEAVREQTELLRLAPHDRAAVHKLDRLREEAEERRGPPVICRRCGHENRRGDTRCRKCEARLTVSAELMDWLTHGGIKQAAWAWVIALVLMTLVLFAASGLPALLRVLLSLAVLFAVIGAEFLYVYRRV